MSTDYGKNTLNDHFDCRFYISARVEYRIWNKDAQKLYNANEFELHEEYGRIQQALDETGCVQVGSSAEGNVKVWVIIAGWYPNRQSLHGTEGYVTYEDAQGRTHTEFTAAGKKNKDVGSGVATPKSDDIIKKKVIEYIVQKIRNLKKT